MTSRVKTEKPSLPPEESKPQRRRFATVPFVLKSLSQRPDVLEPYLRSGRVVTEPKYLSKKEAEVAAISAAIALRCDFCIRTHIARALELGSNLDEIFEVIAISGLIARSSTYAHGLRILDEFKAEKRNH